MSLCDQRDLVVRKSIDKKQSNLNKPDNNIKNQTPNVTEST